MIQRAIDVLFGSKHEKDLEDLLPIVGRINERESWAMSLDASQFPQQTEEFKRRIREGESLDDILPEGFALVREAARRTLGERLYDVQLIGGIVLHQGRIQGR